MISYFQRKPHYWIVFILALGVVYLLALQLAIPDNAYFSGDSGLRALVSRNLASGRAVFDLNLPDPPWIKALWKEGLFPFGAPFVYKVGEKYYSTFPYTFPLVTAPFYALFGYRGLYVVPGLATLITWLMFYLACRRLSLTPAATDIGLFFLIFATHLSLYSAMYWEHTLSVCLSFAGLVLLLPAKPDARLSPWSAAGAGVLTGLAVCFREEQILLVVFLGLVMALAVIRSLWRVRIFVWFHLDGVLDRIGRVGGVYILAGLATLLLYGVTNWLVYHSFFGIHAVRQVFEYQPASGHLHNALENLQNLSLGDNAFVLFVPAMLIPVGVLLLALTRRSRLLYRPAWSLWYAFGLFFLLAVAALVPPGAGGKQWGPRFLLLLAPVVTLLFAWQVDALIKTLPAYGWRRRAAFAIILLAGVVGIIQNPVRGMAFISNNHMQVKGVVAALRQEPAQVIGISSAFLGQMFAPALSQQVHFLRVNSQEQLFLLSQALQQQALHQFIYLCYSNDCGLFDLAPATKHLTSNGASYAIQTSNIRRLGRYTLLDVQVSKEN